MESKEKIKKLSDVVENNPAAGRRGSVIAEKYKTGQWKPKGEEPDRKKFPTNEEVAKAVQQKVADAVEVTRKYRHVAWYSAFVAAYMIVLYLQASAYKSGEVVKTLKKALLPEDGSTTMTFHSEDDVLAYIGEKIILPIWKDPVCGDGDCEWPWEFPAYGRFGCRADCGLETRTTKVAVVVRADFTGHPTISPRVLMANARWNLCLDDPDRRKRGEADLCWFDTDQTFSDIQVNNIEAMDLVDGKWYVVVKGDYAGRVSGAVYDITNTTAPEQLTLTPAWEACKLKKRAANPATTAVRRLLAAYTEAQKLGDEEGKTVMQQAINEVQDLTNKMRENLKNLTRSLGDHVKMAEEARKQAEYFQEMQERITKEREAAKQTAAELKTIRDMRSLSYKMRQARRTGKNRGRGNGMKVVKKRAYGGPVKANTKKRRRR